MIADSAKRQFQGILVYQLDRFSRNRYDSATYKAKLKKNNVKVFSARENTSDDASGVLMETVLEGMAEYFSVELSQKVKRGMTLTAEKCEFTGSGVPLGYKIVEKKFVIDDDEAPTVKRILEVYLEGKTMAEIIRCLNENSLKTRYPLCHSNTSAVLRITPEISICCGQCASHERQPVQVDGSRPPGAASSNGYPMLLFWPYAINSL